RNVLKEFFFDGKVHLSLAGAAVAKTAFDHFDDTELLTLWKDALLTTSHTNVYYQTLEKLIAYTLPLGPEALKEEMQHLLLDRNVMALENREQVLRELLEDLLRRHLGSAALKALHGHIAATRQGDVPIIEAIQHVLKEGE